MEEEKGLNEVLSIAKKVVFRKKLQLLIATVIGGALGIMYSVFLASHVYTSNISFTLEQKGSSIGSLGGLASSLGLSDLPTTNSTGMFGGENILHLIKSNRIIHKSLKESRSDLNGDNLLNRYLATHFKSQIKKRKIKLFPKNISNLTFNREQDSVLLLVTKNIREEQIKVERVDKKTTIINLEVDGLDEQWAYLFSKALVKNAIELYLDIKVGKLLRTEVELTQKKDSIRGLLDGSITTLAYETDLNSHTPLMRYKTKQAKKQIDVEVLKNMYASVIQNLELTKFQRAQEEPIIEIIDEPMMPLKVEHIGKVKGAAFGIILLNVVILSFLVNRNFNQSKHL